MAAKRIDRKQLLKEPDEFFTITGRIINWAKSHPRELTYAVCAFLAVVVLSSGYRYFAERRSQAASNLLGQVLITYQQEIAKGDPGQALKAVEPELKRLTDSYSGQPAGRVGLVYYAHFSAAARENDTAVALYQHALERFQGDPTLTNVLIQGLANAYEQKGDSGEAIEQYQKIAQGPYPLHKADALFQLGRLYRQAGQPEKSREVLERLSKDFPDSIYAQPAIESSAG